ncbi:hypothetical protein CGRA01v4_07670 [Colletotrichum graminicola]|nr:hypothetical protein CGRA01v4_07670 [Colletotrichum graminicola]
MRDTSERTERGEGVSCKSQGEEEDLGRSRDRRRRLGTSRRGDTKQTSSAPMMKATAERAGIIHIKVACERGLGGGVWLDPEVKAQARIENQACSKRWIWQMTQGSVLPSTR